MADLSWFSWANMDQGDFVPIQTSLVFCGYNSVGWGDRNNDASRFIPLRCWWASSYRQWFRESGLGENASPFHVGFEGEVWGISGRDSISAVPSDWCLRIWGCAAASWVRMFGRDEGYDSGMKGGSVCINLWMSMARELRRRRDRRRYLDAGNIDAVISTSSYRGCRASLIPSSRCMKYGYLVSTWGHALIQVAQ